jgi:hypothetical protein
MKIQINGRYAYETDLQDVEIGDEMLLPGTLSSDSWTGIVTSLEPDYDGPCRKALGLTRRRAQVLAKREALDQVQITGWKAGETIPKSCSDCGKERRYVVETTNNIGRPVSLSVEPCSCGNPGGGASFGSAASFRHFMIDPSR